MLIAGIDCGTRSTKAVVVKGREIVGKGITATGIDQVKAVESSLERAMRSAGVSIESVQSIAATGVEVSLLEEYVQPIIYVPSLKAMVMVIRHLFSGAHTVLDVGAEGIRAGRIDDGGRLVNFAMNDKCAAGTGSFLETMARALEVDVNDLGDLALKAKKLVRINAQCAIFAESEVVGLIHENCAREEISYAIIESVVMKAAAIVHRLGIHPDIGLIGGVSLSATFREMLRNELDINKILVAENPEYALALGAVLFVAGAEVNRRW